MTPYEKAKAALRRRPRRWLLTGAAGFIGSHLLQELLRLGQTVVGLDNFSTGSPVNLERVRASVSKAEWKHFRFQQGTVVDMNTCREAAKGAQVILHEAGFISVPLSLKDPLACHDTNVTGTLNLLIAARDQKAQRFVIASSSAVYGDDPAPQKREDQIGQPLSPYGASKRMGEIYLRLFTENYGLSTVALRYFNVFGPGQNPSGGYAAVIPQWIVKMLQGETCQIHGDGSNTRDFCPVQDIVQANLLAGSVPPARVQTGCYNVGRGESTDLRKLHQMLAESVATIAPRVPQRPPKYGRARAGDIIHSTADISRIQQELGFTPTEDLRQAFVQTARWFVGST